MVETFSERTGNAPVTVELCLTKRNLQWYTGCTWTKTAVPQVPKTTSLHSAVVKVFDTLYMAAEPLRFPFHGCVYQSRYIKYGVHGNESEIYIVQ